MIAVFENLLPNKFLTTNSILTTVEFSFTLPYILNQQVPHWGKSTQKGQD